MPSRPRTRLAGLLTLALALPAAAEPPAVRLTLAGQPERILAAEEMTCADDGTIDVTDIPVTAFRQADGSVIVLAGNSNGHFLAGPSVDAAARQGCDSILRSAFDADPSQFRDKEWVLQLYSPDGGRTVYGFIHNEYHGELHGEEDCILKPSSERQCWYAAITWIRSTDGGRTFTRAEAPGNLVISLPFRYTPKMPRAGVGMPKVVRRGDWLYILGSYTNRAFAGEGGQCLLRAPAGRPEAWEVWTGRGFDPVPPSPYEGPNRPAAAPCEPVVPGNVMSLKWMPDHGVFIALLMSRNDLYYLTSPDLIRWSDPELFFARSELIVGQDPARVKTEDLPRYFSLLDPNSPSPSFDTLDDSFQMYFVQYRNQRGERVNERRDVFRVAVEAR